MLLRPALLVFSRTLVTTGSEQLQRFGLDTGFPSPEQSIQDITQHMAGVGVIGKALMDARESVLPGSSWMDAMDFSTHKAAEEVMSWANENDIDPGVAAAMAVGKSVSGRMVDPSAPVGSVFSPEVLSNSFKTEFDVNIEDVPTVSLSFTKDLTSKQERDRYMEQAVTVPSPLADPGINVQATIAEALTRGRNAIAEMGLTGATAAAAEQAMTSSSGYITVDQIAGLVAAQQEQEQVAAEQAAAEQALAEAQAAAAAAVEDFSGVDWGGSGDDQEDPDDTGAGFGTVSNEAIAEVMEKIAIDNIIAEALEGGYGRGGSVEADYGDVGGGGEFGGAGGGGMGGFGGWT